MTDRIPDDLRRALLDEAPGVPDDPAFWSDFSRDVRLGIDAAIATRKQRWRILQFAIVPALAVTATVAMLVSSDTKDQSESPATVAIEAGEHANESDDNEPLTITDVELLGDDELEAVFAEINDFDIDEPDDELDTAGVDPYTAVEELSNEDLRRVLDALTKGA